MDRELMPPTVALRLRPTKKLRYYHHLQSAMLNEDAKWTVDGLERMRPAARKRDRRLTKYYFRAIGW